MGKSQPVVVTGLGTVNPLGVGVEKTFSALCNGENGIRELPHWKEAGFPVTYAGTIAQADRLFEKEAGFAQYRSRKTIFGVTALREAVSQANPDGLFEGRGGTFLGIETGRIDINKLFKMFTQAGTRKALDLRAFGEKCFNYINAQEALSKQPFFIAGLMANSVGATGEARSVSNACSSSNQAIGEAFRKVATGKLDWAIAGGTDDMVDEYMAIGFHLLGALSEKLPPEEASRPFDIGRRGFVLGEGAGILIFESLDHARQRGAKPLCLVSGYGSSCSAGKITETTSEGILQTMVEAIREAGVDTDEVDYINAHGTATHMNDPAECEAIRKLFGEKAKEIPTSSTKSMIGHLIAAAGAVEAVVCGMSIVTQKIHPTRNLTRVDPLCGLDFVPGQARSLPLRHVLSNSLGFAGINSSLLFSQFLGP